MTIDQSAQLGLLPREPAAADGRVEAIYLAGPRGEPRTRVPRVRAVAGMGLEGDRFFGEPPGKHASVRQVTLIEAEAVDALREQGMDFAPGDARRNVVTRGVRLNDLVGREFRVGGALLRGVELCHPCAHLERLTQRGVMRGLRNRGGLRAEVVEGGEVREGDPVSELDGG